MSNKEESTGRLNALARQCHEDSERWFGDTGTTEPGHDLVHHVLSLCGEAGELANLVKKIDRGSLDINDPSTRIKLASETTDVFVYLLNIAYILRVDLERSYLHIRANNEDRFMKERNARDERRDAGS
jgi:NTP pyrophosphatase (non-canonical NTP hydrolase)